MCGDQEMKDLYVYECRGPSSPLNFPQFPGLLGIWPEPPFYYVFCREEGERVVRQWVEESAGWELRASYRLPYSRWQQFSREDQKVGPFVIRWAGDLPSKCREWEGTTLLLEPGIIFGSGLHPTTRACLLLLDEWGRRFHPESVVDFGTGTGILAIAAALLGAKRVFALDCNPLAVLLARRNMLLNRPEQEAHFIVCNEPGVLGKGMDLLMANVEWPGLRKLLAAEDQLEKHRLIILSGFLEGQKGEFQSMLSENWKVIDELNLDGWVALAAVNRRLEKGAGENPRQ